MRRLLLATTLVLACLHPNLGRAGQYGNSSQAVRIGSDAPLVLAACINAAAKKDDVPPFVLIFLLEVEGGQLGRVSENTDGSVDIGPFQVNQLWIPTLARHWGVPQDAAFLILRDNICGNAEAAAYVLRLAMNEVPGDFWEGVARYHSHNPELQRIYLQKLLKRARALVRGGQHG